jgi:hypothetical protein
MSKDIFETLAQDSLETTDGEIISGNQTEYNFDEVEKLTDDTDEVKELEKQSKKEEPKTANDSQKTLDDAVKQKTAEKKMEKDDEGIEEKVENKEREETEQKSEVKKITAKNGEDNLEIPANITIPHKVDGEEVEIPLQELLNNYSGKQAWDKRFSELDVERKEYQKERDIVERYVEDFAKLAQGEDKLAAMEYLAQFAGVNPVEFRQQLRQQVLDKYGNYQEMTEFERKALDQEEELSYHKRLRESELQRTEEQKVQTELQTRLSEIQETHNISEDDLTAAYQELVKDYEGEITIDTLEKYVVNKQAWFNAKEAVSEVSPDLAQQEGFVEDIADLILSNPELDAEDIQEIISEVSGTAKKRQKQQKASDLVRENQIPSKKEQLTQEEYFSFDDL